MDQGKIVKICETWNIKYYNKLKAINMDKNYHNINKNL